MTNLTDRYVWATVRSLPEKQRADIERELRASIADAIDARDAADPGSKTVESDVLTDMGDPARLAAEYAERPSFLIGPAYFFDYWRLLMLLLAIVPAAAFVGIMFSQTLAGEDFGPAALDALVTTVSVTVHLCFWITLGFAVIERTGKAGHVAAMKWSVDRLPELPAGTRVGLVETLFAVVFLALFAGLLVWQQFNAVFTDVAGNPIPFVNPELWSFWLPYFIGLILLEIIFAIVLHRLGRWTWSAAWVNVGLNIAFAVPAVWLMLQDLLLNPAFIARLDWLDPVGASFITPGVVVGAVAIAAWDIIDGFLKARRAQQ